MNTETGKKLYIEYEMELANLKYKAKEVKATKTEENEKQVKKSIKNIKKMAKETKTKKKFVEKFLTNNMGGIE